MNGYLASLNRKGSSKEYRKNWPRLIQKIYEVDLLTSPFLQQRRSTISFFDSAYFRNH
jgi:hypothetical protein